MNKKSKESEPAFPGKVNAMGYRDGLTKLEFISALIMANKSQQNMSYRAAAQESIEAAKTLLQELNEQE